MPNGDMPKSSQSLRLPSTTIVPSASTSRVLKANANIPVRTIRIIGASFLVISHHLLCLLLPNEHFIALVFYVIVAYRLLWWVRAQ